ncbi:hypothetical protein EVAR_8494_1 [Eumeta japonica]|uniref:Uncharacterized protein n=1 Tax=Eumeta variegata TaxID=151549 RepID=A0A4C1XPJ6_EUMVA|nr:hypothetical protein EVAR_8494_1 [Eumeta japonica]
MGLRLRRKLVGRAAAPPAQPHGIFTFYSVDRNVSHETRAADRPSVYPFAYPFITLNVIDILVSYFDCEAIPKTAYCICERFKERKFLDSYKRSLATLSEHREEEDR